MKHGIIKIFGVVFFLVVLLLFCIPAYATEIVVNTGNEEANAAFQEFYDAVKHIDGDNDWEGFSLFIRHMRIPMPDNTPKYAMVRQRIGRVRPLLKGLFGTRLMCASCKVCAYRLCTTRVVSEINQSKFPDVDSQPNDNIVHDHRLGETDRFSA